jgi:hypothetical protein
MDEDNDDFEIGQQQQKSKGAARVTLDIKQEPGESLRDYKRRIRSRTSELLMQHKKDNSKRLQKRKGYMQVKAKEKKLKPSGPDLDSDDELRDDVRFGDVAERPPAFKFTPKKIGGNKLNQKKTDTFKTKQDASKADEMEKLRKEAQEAYKRMKANKQQAKFQR